MSVQVGPFPRRSALTERLGMLLSSTWGSWLQSLLDAVNGATFRLKTVTLTAQGAAIAYTAIPLSASLSAGLYRVSYIVKVTRAATTNSSVTPGIRFTRGGVVCALDGTAVTGNTTASVGTGSFQIRIDEDTAIDHRAQYSSVGATSMLFEIDWVAELVPLS